MKPKGGSRKPSSRKRDRSSNFENSGREDPADIMLRLMHEIISVKENGTKRNVTALEAMLLKLLQTVNSGGARAIRVLNEYGKLIPTIQRNRTKIEFCDDNQDEDTSSPNERDTNGDRR